MYLAELHGKLTAKTEKMEDVLTSNVFSFFKYSNRAVFLSKYLSKLGFAVSKEDTENAEFIFWPRFEKNTEPDLVIIVGKYYIVLEAKYYSGFSEGTLKTKAQLLREIEEGMLESSNYGKQFRLLAITADHYYKKENFQVIPEKILPVFTWTNWQFVASLLDEILHQEFNLTDPEKLFTLDLYYLLERKCLRDFRGIDSLPQLDTVYSVPDSVFFKANTAKFRGDFIGFIESLAGIRNMASTPQSIFFNGERNLFESLFGLDLLQSQKDHVFWKGAKK